jgi:hypothetical protein
VIKNSLTKYTFTSNSQANDSFQKEKKFGLLEEFLVEEFNFFLEHLAPFFTSDLEITIHFLPADTFQNDWIAMYNAQHSSQTKFEICFNQSLATELLHDQLFSHKIELQKAVLHELIHALDHQVISESRSVYLTSKNQYQAFISPQASSNFWIFMHYISSLRNEGIAMYAEHLYFTTEQGETSSYLTRFKEDFQFLVSFCESDLNAQTSFQKIGQICNHLQDYAGFIVRDVVRNQCGNNRSNDRNELLKIAFNIDVSEWITYLFKVYHTNKLEFQADWMFSFFSQTNRLEPTKFSFSDFYSLYDYEDEHYLDFLSNICPVRLPYLDLFKKIGEVNTEDYIHDIQRTLKNQMLILLEIRTDQNIDLIDLTLSYVIHQNDLVDDRLDFVGYLDDWMIMDITMQRINSKQFD